MNARRSHMKIAPLESERLKNRCEHRQDKGEVESMVIKVKEINLPLDLSFRQHRCQLHANAEESNIEDRVG